MEWAVISLDSDMHFKQKQYEIQFLDFSIRVTCEKVEQLEGHKYPKTISHQLAIKTKRENLTKAHETGLMLLSELAWFFNLPIHAVSHGGGSQPFRLCTCFAGHNGGRHIIDLQNYTPMTLDHEQRLAIGLYKEGISNNSPYYRFFSLFNILDIKMKGKQREEWLTSYLKKNFTNTSFKNDYNEFPNSPDDVQRFIYQHGRCGIAHMDSEPRMDVHKFTNIGTAKTCDNILKKAAVHYMVEEMGVPKPFYYFS